MLRARRFARGAIAVVTANLWIAVASAQQPPSVQINFAPVAGVPLSPWLMALLAIVLAASAAAMLHRRKVNRLGRLGAWLFAGICAATLMAVVGPARLLSQAWAVVGTSFPVTLTSSPASIDIATAVDGNAFITATNGLSVPIVINGVSLLNALPLQIIDSVGTTCIAGKTILVPGGTCTVDVLGGVT